MKEDKFETFWLEKDKEEIIKAYRECIHNGEVLLARIDTAIEYIENNGDEIIYSYDKSKELIDKLLDILKGSDSNE